MSTLSTLNPAADAVAAAQARSAPTANPAAPTNPFAELGSTDFVKIMVEELSNQDPFEPNDSAAILEQLSSLRSIESDLSLNESLENLVLQNSIGQAGALIGRDVEGLTPDGQTLTGRVTSVRVVDGQTELRLDDGVSLPLDRVTQISEAPGGPAPGLAPPATATATAPAAAAAAAAAAVALPAGPRPFTAADALNTPGLAELLRPAAAAPAAEPDTGGRSVG